MFYINRKLMTAIAVLFLFVVPFSWAQRNRNQKQVDPKAQSAVTQPAPAPQPVSRFFTGDGGKGMSLAVLVPEAKGLAANQNYLPTLVQGVLVGDLSKYSAISVLDRQRLETVLKETESGIYKNESDFGKLGEIAGTDYALTGSITKTSTGYAMQIQIVGTGSGNIGVTKASYSGTPSIAEMDNFTGIKKASFELLTQLGVNLTDVSRQELSAAAATNNVNAQTALAQGITAQKGDTVVEALSRYIQASSFDPSLAEAASRVNILTANITSGNMGQNIRNDLQWRDQWVARLKECEAYYISQMKNNPPYYLVYSPEIKQGNIDYQKRTVELSITMSLYPDPVLFDTVFKVINTMRQGLIATGRAQTWGLVKWPMVSINSSNQGNLTSNTFDNFFNAHFITVEILNSEGKSIASRTDGLVYGYSWLGFAFRDIEEKYFGNYFKLRPVESTRDFVFPAVDPNAITDNLTIRISGINGMPLERAAEQSRISILTDNEFSQTTASASLIQKRNRGYRFLKTTGEEVVGRSNYREEYLTEMLYDIIVLRSIGNNFPDHFGSEERMNYGKRIRDYYFIVVDYNITLLNNNSDLERWWGVDDNNWIIFPPTVKTINNFFTNKRLYGMTIPANVSITNNSLYEEFARLYNNNSKKAGCYFVRWGGQNFYNSF